MSERERERERRGQQPPSLITAWPSQPLAAAKALGGGAAAG